MRWLYAIALGLWAVAPVLAAGHFYDLGTDKSALRPGFVAVTPKSLYSEATGFGWQSTEGLQAKVRAYRALIENKSRGTKEPPPIWTNEVTEDVIFSDRPADFLVKLPRGKYRAYILCGSSDRFRYQFFDFTASWGQGQPQTRVQIAEGYHFEHRSFDFEADGTAPVRLHLEPQSKWLLNAVLIWPEAEDGRVRREVLAPLEQETFVMPAEEWKKWKFEPHVDETPMPKLSAEDKQRGYLIHHRHYLECVYPNTVPLGRTLNPEVRAFATPGEYEPLTFTVYPLGDLKRATVQVSDLKSSGATIPATAIDIRRVRYMLARPNYRVQHSYRRVPDVLEHFDQLDLKAKENQRFWLTVHVPENAAPGMYRGTATFGAEGAPAAAVPLVLRVLPIRLQRDPGKIFGIYYRHPLDGWARAPDEVSKAYWLRKAELEHQDMVAHGTRNVVLSAWCSTKNEQGRFEGNWDLLGKKIELGRKHNFQPPIVVSINTGGVYRKYMKASYGSHLRAVKDPPPEFSQELTEMVRYVESVRRERGWPEFLYYPIDEPSTAPAAVNFMVKVLKAVRAAGVKTYVTADPTHEQFEPMRPFIDVWCCQPFNPDRETILADMKARGVQYWCYPNHVAGENDHTPVAGARMTYGFGFWRSGFLTLIPWIYQANIGDPWNYLDGSAMDFFNRSAPDGTPIPVALWEAYREGYDDYRYVYTLEQLCEQAEQKGGRAKQAASKAREALKFVWDSINVQTKYKYDDLWGAEEFDVYRWVIAEQILKLQRAL